MWRGWRKMASRAAVDPPISSKRSSLIKLAESLVVGPTLMRIIPYWEYESLNLSSMEWRSLLPLVLPLLALIVSKRFLTVRSLHLWHALPASYTIYFFLFKKENIYYYYYFFKERVFSFFFFLKIIILFKFSNLLK